MTAKQTKRAAKVMLAWVQGKPCVARWRYRKDKKWHPVPKNALVSWDWVHCDYKVV